MHPRPHTPIGSSPRRASLSSPRSRQHPGARSAYLHHALHYHGITTPPGLHDRIIWTLSRDARSWIRSSTILPTSSASSRERAFREPTEPMGAPIAGYDNTGENAEYSIRVIPRNST
eukprot:6040973-Prymnesium_polylepis.1